MIVADLTLVSYTDDQFTLKSLFQAWAKNRFNWSAAVAGIHSTKRSPNANVMLELGYAVGILGWDRVICVMNDHFGKPDDLPFDVRHRRFPFVYTLSPNPGETKAEVRKKLVAKLVEGIEAAEAADDASAKSAIASMDIDCLLVSRQWRKVEYFKDLDQDPGNRDQLAPVLSVTHFRRFKISTSIGSRSCMCGSRHRSRSSRTASLAIGNMLWHNSCNGSAGQPSES